MGFIILHGPHHAAKKSTSTGLSELIISEKVAMVIYALFPQILLPEWLICLLNGLGIAAPFKTISGSTTKTKDAHRCEIPTGQHLAIAVV